MRMNAAILLIQLSIITIAIYCANLDQNTVDLKEKEIVSRQFAVIMKYRQMVERDDKALAHMLGGKWDRSKPLMARSYLLSNGGVTWAYSQAPRKDREYELSF